MKATRHLHRKMAQFLLYLGAMMPESRFTRLEDSQPPEDELVYVRSKCGNDTTTGLGTWNKELGFAHEEHEVPYAWAQIPE